jgi:hypothetical protein
LVSKVKLRVEREKETKWLKDKKRQMRKTIRMGERD